MDGTAGWGGQSVFSWGEPGSATIGQTFTPGADSRLDEFTFFVADALDPEPVTFSAYVMAWTGSRATGPILFQSQAITSTNNGGADGWEATTITTGGLHLNTGHQYVAFLSCSGYFNGVTNRAAFGFNHTDPYAGGTIVYADNGNSFSSLTTTDWVSNFPAGDAAFLMRFNVPGPYGLAVLAPIMFAGMRRRR
ncbi:MAG TPA: hypothetical protein VD997_10285 [Phycisphaerales bacterium]|nr:hypothetical protein [Phycisphaerales bacterium]